MPSQGYFIASAFTSNASIPVEDATVTVTQQTPDGIMELLAIRLTDESGRTEQVAILTPDISISEAPSQERAFTPVIVTVEHPLYERIVLEDVQIFPDTVTNQNLQMIPLEEAPPLWDQTEVFEIPPQNL